jgi:hypothetical protein
MHVAIPSKGRATKVKSQKLITSASVYVPEIEMEAYTKTGVKNLVPVPGSVKGITQTRNWILDNVNDPHVVFIDDDVKTAGYVKLYKFKGEHISLDEFQFLQEWQRLFDIMEDLQYRIWGISTDGAPRSVYPYKPFLFHTYITASCMGILNDGRTRFDETFKVKEDYELNLRCIREDGGILGARYLYWVNDHWKQDGGCKDYRTQDMEKDAIRRLMRMYPGFIRRVKRGGSEYSIELNF